MIEQQQQQQQQLSTPAELDAARSGGAGSVDALARRAYDQVQAQLQDSCIAAFWGRLQDMQHQQQQHKAPGTSHAGLLAALQDLATAVGQQSQQLSLLAQQLLVCLLQQQRCAPAEQQQQQQQQRQAWGPASSADGSVPASTVALLASLCHKHRTAVSSIMMATAPFSLPGLLQQFYQARLAELCEVVQQQQQQQQHEQEQAGSGDVSDAMSEDADQEQDQQQEPRPGSSADPLPLLGAQWVAEVSGVAGCLEQLGLGAASEEAYTRVINGHVLERLQELATQEFDAAVLPRAQRLVCAGPLAFLRLVLSACSPAAAAEARLQEWQLRLTYLMLEALGALRSADMFSIVIDYPDSLPALQDLGVCLQHTSLAAHFVATFRGALQQRLLHAGAATADIIHTYVSTIKAMQHIDKSGLLLDLVSEPIRAYLRSRPDTIRCIVSMLTEDPADAGSAGSASLLQELHQGSQAAAAAGAAGGFGARLAAAAAAAGSAGGPGGRSGATYNWCVSEAEGDEAALRLLEALDAGPADGDAASTAAQQAGLLGLPVRPASGASAALQGAGGAAGGAGAGAGGAADVVSSLIGIYGGPLLFMEEYRRMLAARLLAKGGFDCEREITTLELLKIRFGDGGLHACEIMLKDMADSKRVDANIRALRPGAGAQPLPPAVAAALARVNATVTSYLFWPELQELDLTLPPELQMALEVYAERFRHLKAPRKLQWRPTLGLVDLTLTVGDSGPLDFRVTPVHAALLLQFNDDSDGQGGGATRRSAAQLADALSVPVAVVRRAAMYWVAAGVLAQRRGASGEAVYQRAASIDASRIGSREASELPWQESAGGGPSAADRLVAEMGPFENFITGMLANMGSLPLERLHNLLRVFVVGEPKYEGRSQDQLASFLQLLAEAGKVEVVNGLYGKPGRKPAS